MATHFHIILSRCTVLYSTVPSLIHLLLGAMATVYGHGHGLHARQWGKGSLAE
jgi:hypothetical protein